MSFTILGKSVWFVIHRIGVFFHEKNTDYHTKLLSGDWQCS